MYQSQRGAALYNPTATTSKTSKVTGQGVFASQTYAQAAAAEKSSPATAATYERLTEAELDRMRAEIPGLSRLASIHLRYLGTVLLCLTDTQLKGTRVASSTSSELAKWEGPEG